MSAARVTSAGAVLSLDGKAQPDEVFTAEDAKDSEKAARIIQRLLKDVAELKRPWQPRIMTFEDVPVSTSQSVQLAHGFGGKVRYSLVGWNANGTLAPVLKESSTTTGDVLILDAYHPVVLTLTSQFTTTNGTATDTNLLFPVRNGETWLIEFWGSGHCSTTNGIKYAIGAPSGSTVDGWLYSSSTNTTVTNWFVSQFTAVNTLGSACHSGATDAGRPDFMVARVTAGGSGNISIQVAAATGGDTAKLDAKACLRATRAQAGASTFVAGKAAIRVEEAG